MTYDFDEIIDRKGNFSAKYDELEKNFGRDDLVPMWIADMDFKTAQPIIDAIEKRVKQGIYGYTSRPASYFGAVKDWLKKRHGWETNTDWMIHSPGVVPALSIIVRNFTSPEDKIIIQSPVYYPFYNVIKDNGREILVNPLKKVNGKYVMDYDDLEEKAKQGAKMLILCSPHNPVGRVWTKEELTRLGEICLKYNVKVVSDEIHSDLVLWDNKHIPFASISEEFCKNSITCIAPSKTFNLAGLQASIILFPQKEEKEKFDEVLGVLDIRRNNCFSLVATEAAYRYGEEWLKELKAYLEANIDFVIDYCEKHIPEIKPNRPEGTYLMLLDCSKLGLEGKELENFMVNKARVALDAGYWFGTNSVKYMRMNIACPRAIIKEALERIEKSLQN